MCDIVGKLAISNEGEKCELQALMKTDSGGYEPLSTGIIPPSIPVSQHQFGPPVYSSFIPKAKGKIF